MSADKLRLVRDYAELRTGMLVVVKCDWPDCGKTHRGMLTGQEYAVAISPDGSEHTGYKRRLMPSIAHLLATEMYVSSRTVARRIVYRVEDGLELSTERKRSEVVR